MLKNIRTTNGTARSARGVSVRLAVRWLLLAPVLLAALATPLFAAELDKLDLERWKKLRETERYQLNIAEKYYNDKEWKIAAAEYEKFLTLYEQSEGAGFSQLKWAICQVQLRQANTAIKEGFQTVVDYWPDSPDAVISAYFIGSTYKDIGEIKKAKTAYLAVIDQHPDHLVAAYALRDLIDISNVESDAQARIAHWKKLTFDFKRSSGEINNICVNASRDLAQYYFYAGSVPEAVKAIATTYAVKDIPGQLLDRGSAAIQHLTADEKSREKGYAVADAAIKYIHDHMPSDITKEEDKNLAKQYWYYTADLQHYARRYEMVPKVYEQMIAKFGVDDALLGRFAEWYKGQNNYDQARATFARYVNKIEGQNQIAYSYRQQQKTDLAVEIYRRLALQDQEHVIGWTTQVAASYREVNRFKEAIDAYNELLILDTKNAGSWRYSIGDAYQHAGQYKEAIGSYRLCENFPTNYIRMAECHRALKEWSEAILMYNQVIGTSPGNAAWATLQIGYTQEQAGLAEKAIKTFQSVCDKYSKFGEASTAHSHLKNKYKIDATMGGDTAEK